MLRIHTQTINKQIIPNFILGINFNKLSNPNNLQVRNKVSMISNIFQIYANTLENYIKITFKVNVNYRINIENRIFIKD